MVLTKDMRKLLDFLIDTKPDYLGGFYTIKNVIKNYELNDFDTIRILRQLRECGAISPMCGNEDKFFITEYGMKYKEIKIMLAKEKWKERIIGFVSGVVLTLFAWALAYFI